ncbi:hypothetical protein KDU71_07485 [Carboxylicivirga sediminis]|uniref:Uncharacterized protein n=1 Tax=Carboxylicivirga sediminis TaxID=2006564 RepID=A0A941F255_9BACT|nr:hypothetical protein [Carboxylicivirga sediminis]MBR8535398.1 hypothetical protein [Carboxylicivirga sediminis]
MRKRGTDIKGFELFVFNIKNLFWWLKYTLFFERWRVKHNDIIKSALDKGNTVNRIREAMLTWANRRWGEREFLYKALKEHRCGSLAYQIDPYHIRAKELYLSSPFKSLKDIDLSRPLAVFRPDVPYLDKDGKYKTITYGYRDEVKVITTRKIEYKGNYRQVDSINGYGVTCLRYATEEEIMQHIKMQHKKEALLFCRKHNTLPIVLH